ncbi:MAG: TonB family protein [Alphaproteobacteria bacterium]|nr:TonB family protein [Alphaproteobacteria bacterium]
MKKVMIAGLAFLLAGCVTDTPVKKSLTEPCQISSGGKYITEPPALIERASGKTDIPEKAQRAQINGCVSYEYQIDKNGNVKNVRVLAEEPKGYDLGNTAAAQAKRNLYEKPAKPDQWYLTITSWHLGE